jgi:hypothetical protein
LTIQQHGVQTLLMGGQACVFYGAAQVSKDIDFMLLANEANFERLRRALEELKAERIAVPRFDPVVLDRGHAVHFRCQAETVKGLRVDVMTKLRGLGDFAWLWERRTVFQGADGAEYHLLSVPDLVQAKKTQRSKDWPVIELLVDIHYRENAGSPRQDWIEFWLTEARSPELLTALSHRFASEAREMKERRPVIELALNGDLEPMRIALDEEVRTAQATDRAYWEPLRREIEAFRKEERLA